jgi:uncharacterized protein YaaN involved in tellurite resistance
MERHDSGEDVTVLEKVKALGEPIEKVEELINSNSMRKMSKFSKSVDALEELDKVAAEPKRRMSKMFRRRKSSVIPAKDIFYSADKSVSKIRNELVELETNLKQLKVKMEQKQDTLLDAEYALSMENQVIELQTLLYEYQRRELSINFLDSQIERSKEGLILLKERVDCLSEQKMNLSTDIPLLIERMVCLVTK